MKTETEGVPRTRKTLPETGADWPTLKEKLLSFKAKDVQWKRRRLGVFIYYAGDDVFEVGKEAYDLYHVENALGSETAFPSLKRMEEEVVDMGLQLLNGPEDACGNMTSGGSESILLAVKACRDRAKAQSRETLGGELIVPRSAHPAFDKAALYLGLTVKRISLQPDHRADVQAMADAITHKTLMLVGSAPCYPYGLVDPIEELSDLAIQRNLWLHVDACVGGYLLPFLTRNGVDTPHFDFTLPGVSSISADLHKFGYTPKAASTLFHRTKEQRAYQMFEFTNWPSGAMSTPTAAGTRSGGPIAGAWAVMHYLGSSGYQEKARQIVEVQRRVHQGLKDIADVTPLHDRTYSITPMISSTLDIHAVWRQMINLGWFSSSMTEPKAMHMMFHPAHLDVVDEYLEDLKKAANLAREKGIQGGVEARYN